MTQEAIALRTDGGSYPGLAVIQDINKALATLGTDFAGPDDPAALAGPFMTWADTGNMLLKRRNAANMMWIDQGPLFTQALIAPVVGSMRNGKMSVPAASATATFTAVEIVVATALGGTPYRLASYNQTINLATTGAGGMDTGTAPLSGWVALYAIYNPATAATSILAKNATSGIQTETYTGASMPAGYTASALLSVWPIDGAGKLKIALQQDRTISSSVGIYGGAGVGSFTALNISSAVPANAKIVNLNWAVNTSGASFVSAAVCPTAGGAGFPGYSGLQAYVGAAGAAGGHFHDIPLITPQQIYHVEGGAGSHSLNCYGYTF